ncbi:MAG: hypothetical protein IKP67_08470 [Spirochaetales bacterium]|nr:hypothetical protein [Spirochaetales bacterium]
MVIKEASYSIEVGKNNPYVKPIACIIAGVALALPLIFVLLLRYGILQISPRGVVIAISMYAGLLTIGIIVSMTAPTFIGAATAVTLTGKIVDFKTRFVSRQSRGVFPIVEYSYGGQTYQKSLPNSRNLDVGSQVTLLVHRKNPAKSITKKQLALCIIVTILSVFAVFPIGFLLVLFCWGLPTFIRAAHSDKVTGEVINIASNHMEYSGIVEYEYGGETYQSQLSSWSSVRPTINDTKTLRVDPRHPDSAISIGQVIFAAFALLVFTAGGILFCSLGFFIPLDNTAVSFKGTANGISKDMLIGLLIWGGFILFWLLLGIILLIRVKKRENKQSLRDVGIKQVCVIDNVSVNTSIEINGEHPVRLTLSGGGRTYTVKTKTSFKQCKYHDGDTVDVYIDPQNEKKYLADIDE